MLNQLNEARYVFHLFPSFDGSFVAIRITKEANAQCDQIRRFLKKLHQTKNGCGYSMGNVKKYWGYFLFQHLVTLQMLQTNERKKD